MRTAHRLALIGLASLAPLAAQATVLTFSNNFGTGGIAAYGDRVIGPSQNGAAYGEGDGWTPNVTLDFTTLGNQGLASLWNVGYASLLGALGHGAFDVPYRIDFVPDAGYLVTLNNFKIATWSGGSYQTDIRIWDDNGSFAAPNLFSFNQRLLPSTVYQPLSAPVMGSGTVRMYLNNLGSTGLDDIHFVQSPIPEPGSLALMGLGLAGLMLAARRRRDG